MPRYKAIIFDCMETLIDMLEIPGEREYALWAYQGSGVEHYWIDFQEFYEDFLKMRQILKNRTPLLKEYDIQTRFKLIIDKKLGNRKGKEEERDWIAGKLFENYWTIYRDKCYVSKEVKATLAFLSKKYKLGLVSNFLVSNGIEELLIDNEIDNFFDFVVTSVNEGWRKPHPNIYKAALSRAGVSAAEVVFIGDDYINDFITPKQLGYQVILYDRKKAYPQLKWRFNSFVELKSILKED